MELKYLVTKHADPGPFILVDPTTEQFLDTIHINNLQGVRAYCQGLEDAGAIRAYNQQPTGRYDRGSEVFLIQFELLDEGRESIIDSTLKEHYQAIVDSATEFMAKTFSQEELALARRRVQNY